jgi:methylated-DNA-[protein]-cysteine S-methyltransferase
MSGKGVDMFYQIINAGKERIGIVWQYVKGLPQLEYVYLPRQAEPLKDKIPRDFPEVMRAPQKSPGDTAEQIARIYAGEKVNFDFSLLNLSRLNKFAEKVLMQTCKIPRGRVATYSGLAAKIGAPGAARAVGTALANNPFPLVIPCHRVVRSDGSLGGFGGGIEMKKDLLNKEGVVFDGKDRVSAKKVFSACS